MESRSFTRPRALGVALFLLLAATPGCMWGTGGNNQVGLAGTPLPQPLVTTLWNNDNQPLAGITLHFSVVQGGGSVSPASGVTDGSGRVQTALALGAAPGLNKVVATTGLQGVKNDPFTFTAWAADSASWTIYNDQNATRAQHGLPPLQMNVGLCQLAQGWSNQMAAQGFISHNPALASSVAGIFPNWMAAAENVGVGPTSNVGALYQAFLDSPHHYENIVGDYNYVGVASTFVGGTFYVTIDFAKAP